MIWRSSRELFFREAVKVLSRNKLRTTLAAISIMIGIAAVVCVVAIGRAGYCFSGSCPPPPSPPRGQL